MTEMLEVENMLEELDKKVRRRLMERYKGKPIWQDILENTGCQFRGNCKEKNLQRLMVQCYSPIGYRTCPHWRRKAEELV